MLRTKLVVIFFFIFASIAHGQNTTETFEQGKLWVKAKESHSLEWNNSNAGKPVKNEFPFAFSPEKYSITGIYRQSKIQTPEFQKLFRIEFADYDKTNELIKELEASGLFEFVEKIPKYELFHTPNDLDSRQWNLKKIMAEQAWDKYRGNCEVVVAIVDDALDTTHPDLRPAIWRNTGEIPGNGIDDDGNGYVDDWYGWDAADETNNSNPHATANTNFHSHGTHVGGITGAYTDNNLGIASIGYRIKLMPVKIGYVDSSSIPMRIRLRNSYDGVEYAILNKADIVNMSWGREGGGVSQTEQMLYNYGHSQGIIFVAAAGNTHNQNKSFPASYNNVLSVGSTDSTDLISFYSKYGDWVDIMAPGRHIWSTVPGNGYDFKMGTSMAAPLVSGLLALMKCRNDDYTPAELISCLKESADNIDGLNSQYAGKLGAGRINALKALECMSSLFVEADFRTACPGQSIQFSGNSKNNPTTWQWSFPGGNPASSSLQNPVVSYNTEGFYNVTLIASNATVSDTLVLTNFIEIKRPEAVISGNIKGLQGSTVSVRIEFTGLPGWNIVIDDGIKLDTITNIQTNPYYYQTIVNDDKTLSIVEFSDSLCTGTGIGSADVSIYYFEPCGDESIFQINFGGNSSDRAIDICESSDGKIIVSGNTGSFGGSNTNNSFVSQLNSEGEIEWYKSYRATRNSSIFKHVTSPTGHIYVCGYTDPYVPSGKLFIAKLRPNGSLIWSKSYGGSYVDRLYDMIFTKDNNLLAVGHLVHTSRAEEQGIMKVDTNGNVIWDRYLGYSSTHERTAGLVELDNDNYIVFGVNISNTKEVYLTSINKNGQLNWYKVLNNSSFPSINRSVVFYTGSFLTKDEQNNLYILYEIELSGGKKIPAIGKCDADGNTIWLKHVDHAKSIRPFSIKVKNGTVFIISTMESGDIGGNDIVSFTLDTDGKFLESELIGESKNDLLTNLVISNTDYLYLAGESNSFSSNINSFVAKFDCYPKAYCNQYELSLNFKDLTYKFNTATISLNSQNLTAANFSFVESSHSLQENIICKFKPTYYGCIQAKDTIRKYSMRHGNLGLNLTNYAHFGKTTANMGDIDGDGIPDMAICEWNALNNGGSVHLLFPNADLTIKKVVEIKGNTNGMGAVPANSLFGKSATNIGDLDGDGINELAVGVAWYRNNNSERKGGVYILFLNSDGKVRDSKLISTENYTALDAAIPISSPHGNMLGISGEGLGDLDGDGVPDIAVGSWYTDDNGQHTGSVFILFLNSDGTMKSFQRISNSFGNLGFTIAPRAQFGTGLCNMGDITGNGLPELVVGLKRDKQNIGEQRGGIAFLSLNSNGTVRKSKMYNSDSPIFKGKLQTNENFGAGIELFSTNADGTYNLLVGSPGYSVPGKTTSGCVSLVTVDSNFEIRKFERLFNGSSAVTGSSLLTNDRFGSSVTVLGDITGDGFIETIIGAPDDTAGGGIRKGAFYIMSIKDSCANINPIDTSDGKNQYCVSKAIYSLDKDVICPGEEITAVNQSIFKPNAVFEWKIFPPTSFITHTGSNLPKFKIDDPGAYSLLLILNDSCGTDTMHLDIFVNANPIADIIDDTLICSADSIHIGGTHMGLTQYYWTPSTGLNDNQSSNPKAFITQEIVYKVKVIDLSTGCETEDSVRIGINILEDRFSLGNDTILCENELFVIQPDKSVNNPLWSTGSTENSITVYTGGLFWLQESEDLCTFRDSIYITRNQIPVFSLGDNLVLCEGKSIELKADRDISMFYRTWDDGSHSINRNITLPGLYFLTITDSVCTYSDTVLIDSANFPVIHFTTDSVFCIGDTVILNAFHPDYHFYLWQDGNIESFYHVTQAGTYEVQVFGECGDTTYKAEIGEVDCSCELYVPTAFSPNNDGLNDFFKPSYCELGVYKLEVFSRWGQKLFESNDILKGWDGKFKGKLMPPESYTWIVTMQHDYRNDGNVFQKAGVVNMVY